MHTLAALAMTELILLTRARKWMASRAIDTYLGCIYCDGVEYTVLTRTRKRVMSKTIHAYLGCIGCDGVVYIDKDEE